MIWWCLCVCVFSILCLQVGNDLGFWGGFSCFVYFIWCQLFAWLIRAAIFCLPPAFQCCFVFLSLPQAFVTCSSFLCRGICVRSLSFTAFSAVGICVRLFVFALLTLVSGYQCTSQFLVSCCALAAPSRLPCGQPYKFRFEGFEANPIWYSTIKFPKSHSAKCSLHKWAWLRCSVKVSWYELYKFDPFLPHSGSIPQELVHSYVLGCLWVVTVCCNTVGRHG